MLEVKGSLAPLQHLPGSAVQGQQSCSIVELEQGMALAGTVASFWLCSPLSLMGPCRNLGQAHSTTAQQFLFKWFIPAKGQVYAGASSFPSP